MKHFALICVLCVSALSLSAQTILTAAGLAAFGTNTPAAGGGGGCTPSYPSPAGTGLSVTDSNPDGVFQAFSVGELFDGTFNNVDWMSGSVAGKRIINIHFTDNAKLVTEFKFTWSGAPGAATAVMKWQGSNDGSSWADITGTTFSFNTGGAVTTDTSLSGNTTEYAYYSLLGISGAVDSGPFLQQIEPKLCH